MTIKKTREEALNEASGYSIFKGQSITNEKFIKRCHIRKLSISPFYIFYWTDEQIKFWNTVRDYCLPLSLDSTGSLAKKYQIHGFKSKTLFYYVMVVGIAGKIIPVFQALTSIHHVPILKEGLDRWLESCRDFSF